MSTDKRVEATAEGIASFIVDRTNDVWQKNKVPYLLSDVSPDLKLHEISYKEILGVGTTLKQFVGTLSDRVRLVQHPVQKAKLGIIPKDSAFTFEAEPTVGSPASVEERPKKIRQPSQRYVVLQFLAALSRLKDEDLKSVNIPVHVLARLMEDK